MNQKLLLLTAIIAVQVINAQDVTTYAGIAGNAGINVQSTMTPSNAIYYEPFSIAWDSSGRTWIAEKSGNRLRVIYGSQVIVRVGSSASQAGTTNGAGVFALFNFPQAVAVASDGTLFIADGQNNCIRTTTAFTNAGQSQFTSDFAGKNGPGLSTRGFVNDTGIKARFYNPMGMIIDKNNNLYVADASNNAIRKITPGGIVSTVAGTGTGGFLNGNVSVAKFSRPVALCFMGDHILLVADAGNQRIRKINLDSGTVSTFAGDGQYDFDDGPVSTASFNYPGGVAYDDSTGFVYVTDAFPVNRIRRIGNDTVYHYAGNPNDTATGTTDGKLTDARFNNPQEIKMYKGFLYVCDADNHTIRKIVPASKAPNAGLTRVYADLSLTLYPNPSNGIFHFESNKPASVTVTNMLGELVSTTSEGKRMDIDLSGLPGGIYIGHALSVGGSRTFRLELLHY